MRRWLNGNQAIGLGAAPVWPSTPGFRLPASRTVRKHSSAVSVETTQSAPFAPAALANRRAQPPSRNLVAQSSPCLIWSPHGGSAGWAGWAARSFAGLTWEPSGGSVTCSWTRAAWPQTASRPCWCSPSAETAGLCCVWPRD